MAVANGNYIDIGEIFYMAWYFGVSFWTHETKWTASFLEDWIEENSQSPWKFHVVTCVS